MRSMQTHTHVVCSFAAATMSALAKQNKPFRYAAVKALTKKAYALKVSVQIHFFQTTV